MTRTRRTDSKTIGTIVHADASRRNIPIAECQSVMSGDDQAPVRLAYARRNRDLGPQFVWRGKVQCIYFDPPYGIKLAPVPLANISGLKETAREVFSSCRRGSTGLWRR